MDMKTTYHVYYPDREAVTREVEWPLDPGYDRIKALIEPILDGGLLEHVSVLHNDRRADMFVDEIGRHKMLTLNVDATAIYRAHSLKRSPGTKPQDLPAIYGTAILFDRIVWF